MDPLTQGALGAALPQATRNKTQIGIAGTLGFFAGMTADLPNDLKARFCVMHFFNPVRYMHLLEVIAEYNGVGVAG